MKSSNSSNYKELLDLLCTEGGFVLSRCEEDFGGTYAWSTKGSNTRICGYKTEQAAREGFIADATGSKMGKIMLDLLRKHYKP